MDLPILWQILIFMIGMVVGFGFLLRPLQIVNIIGKMPWAEEKLGPGGTYSAVKLFGIFLMIVSIIVLINF
jgi:hypothetical protein